MTSSPRPSSPQSANTAPNPTLVELRSLRRELAETREEVVKLRADLDYKKLPNISDQVAIGMFKAGALLWAIGTTIGIIVTLFR
jgi:hypothetical protein